MNEIKEIVSRGDCYKLLAACFYEPDKQLFVEEKLAENIEALMEQFSTAAKRAAKKMQTSLSELSQERLSVDHAALFVGPFELIAAPYGSVHIEKKHTVKEDSTMFVARCYHEAGLSVDIKEPEDHVALELEFMYYLCGKEAEALGANMEEAAKRFRNMQISFHFKAMKPWIKEFCTAIHDGTTNEFYKSVAHCLKAFFASCENYYGKVSPATMV